MNPLDMIIVVILGYFGTISFFRGFVKEAFALGGLGLGIILANVFYSMLGDILLKFVDFPSPAIANIMGYLIIFIAVAIAMYVLGFLAEKFVKLVLLKWLDRSLGFVLGFIKGFLIVAVLSLVVGIVMPRKATFIQESVLLPYIESSYVFFPDHLLSIIKEKKNEFEIYLEKQTKPKSDENKSENPSKQKKEESQESKEKTASEAL